MLNVYLVRPSVGRSVGQSDVLKVLKLHSPEMHALAFM